MTKVLGGIGEEEKFQEIFQSVNKQNMGQMGNGRKGEEEVRTTCQVFILGN